MWWCEAEGLWLPSCLSRVTVWCPCKLPLAPCVASAGGLGWCCVEDPFHGNEGASAQMLVPPDVVKHRSEILIVVVGWPFLHLTTLFEASTR